MKINAQNTRLIFGLKVRQLRTSKSLSFAELSKLTGISVSYLNEIEKGKKFPKPEKIKALAKVLDLEESELTSNKLPAKLQPISDLLASNFLQELPLDMFGIEPGKIIEIVANAPTKVGAFISAILEISRNFQLQQEHFYFAALRSYQELHNNYFEEIEANVDRFVNKHRLSHTTHIRLETLYEILESEYGFSFDNQELAKHPELKKFRSVNLPDKQKLLINQGLTETQQAFLLGKELGYIFQNLKERIFTSSFVKIKSFEEVLNNFKASYFAGALLMNREKLVDDIKLFFDQPSWNAADFLSIMDKYKATPEMFLHRLTNIIPRYFGIEQLFFLRFNQEPGKDQFWLTKELHLKRKHQPHGNGLSEHYCRRWITLWLLNDLHQIQEAGTYSQPIAGIQRSKFHGTEDEYLCFTIARPGYPTPNTNVSISIGLLIDKSLHKQIAFLDDPAIPVREVNQTCQRCSIMDCKERVAPPTIVDEYDQSRKTAAALRKLGK